MLILYNAKIRTLWEELPAAEALAIRDGRILAVGSNDQITTLADSASQGLDLNGQTVWPGLTDAHIHLENYAASLQYVDCETPSREECLRRALKAPGFTATAGTRTCGRMALATRPCWTRLLRITRSI